MTALFTRKSQTTTPWPENVITRYLTVAGAALGREDLTVDVETLTSADSGDAHATRSTCRGCTASKVRDYALYRHYWDEEGGVRACQDDARRWAQAHAETCRSMPRPENP